MTGFFYDPALEEEMSEPGAGRRWPRRLLGLIGLALGLALGLGYAWGLNPVQFYNTDPVDLHPRHKETWILLVAAVYRQDGDLDRAMGRLAGLDDPQIVQSVAELTVRHIRTGQPATRIRALAALADALGARTDEMLAYLSTPQPTPSFTPTPAPPTPTPTPTATPTPTPTATPTPSPSPTAPPATPTSTAPPTLRPTPTGPPPYYLEERQRLCLAGQEAPRIEIVVQTKEGAGIPNSEIWVTWNGGADRFFTGLKPEVGLGYADFDMAMDVVYTIAVDEPTLPVATGLNTRPCMAEDGVSALTSWRLTIVATSSTRTPTPIPTPTILPSATAPPTPTPDRTRAIP